MVWRMGTLTKLVRNQWLAQLMATVIREKYGIVCNIFVLAHACVCSPSHVSNLYTIQIIAPLLGPLVRDHSSIAGPRPQTQILTVWLPSLNYF